MHRVTGKNKKPPVDQDDEPDLYRINEICPLPAAGSSSHASSKPIASATSSIQQRTSGSEYSGAIRALASSSSRQAAASVASLQVQGNSAAASLLGAASIGRTLGALSNPYAAALAAQLQQKSQQQQQQHNYHCLLSAAAQVPYPSFVNPSVVRGSYLNSSMQQLLQQYDLACLSSLLQGTVGGTPTAASLPVGMSNLPTNANGETPIMYIPVYASTLAGLGGVSQQENNNGSYIGNYSV